MIATAYDTDKIRSMVGWGGLAGGLTRGAAELWTPDAPTYQRERRVGATTNHLDEPIGGTTEVLELHAIERTVKDMQRDEVVGRFRAGDRGLLLQEDLLQLGDRVVKISTGEPFEVIERMPADVAGSATGFGYIIRRQTD